MHEDQVKLLDDCFIQNYKEFIQYTKRITPEQNDYENLVHDVYLRLRKYIEKNGLHDKNLKSLIKTTILNCYKMDYKKNQRHQFVEIEDKNYNKMIEDKLLFKESLNEQDQERYEDELIISTMIYEFVEKYYDEKEQFVFKTYFKLQHKHMNLQQLAKICGYSIFYVQSIIQKIKKDLRMNLKEFILSGEITAEDQHK